MKIRKKKLLKIYFIFIIFATSASFLIWWDFNLFSRYSELDNSKLEQQNNIKDTLKNSEILKNNLIFLETRKGTEKILIEKNNLKKPGERVIRILDY
jgi:hypothetical protein